MIAQMTALQKPAYQSYLKAPKSVWYARLIIIFVGVIYGLSGIAANAAFVADFESALLRNAVVPAIFIIFGLVSVWLTKVGLTVLLWAGAKGFGGEGKMKELGRMSAVALIPGILAIPALTGFNGGLLMIAALVISVIWMFSVCVKIYEVTQNFPRWKAAASVLAVFIFFASIYYIVMPTGTIS